LGVAAAFAVDLSLCAVIVGADTDSHDSVPGEHEVVQTAITPYGRARLSTSPISFNHGPVVPRLGL